MSDEALSAQPDVRDIRNAVSTRTGMAWTATEAHGLLPARVAACADAPSSRDVSVLSALHCATRTLFYESDADMPLVPLAWDASCVWPRSVPWSADDLYAHLYASDGSADSDPELNADRLQRLKDVMAQLVDVQCGAIEGESGHALRLLVLAGKTAKDATTSVGVVTAAIQDCP